MGIKNYKELSQKLNEVVESRQQRLTDAVNRTINTFIEHYYSEYEPEVYKRTYQFLKSCLSVNVKKIGKAYFSSVFIDYENMHYMFDFGFGAENGLPINGEQIIEAANLGDHGVEIVAYHSDQSFWNDGLNTAYNAFVLKEYAKWITQYTGCKCVRR